LGSVTFPREHHLEVLTDSQRRQSNELLTIFYVVAAAIVIFFLLQVAVTSWRVSLLLFALLPLSVSGGVIAAALVRNSKAPAAASVPRSRRPW